MIRTYCLLLVLIVALQSVHSLSNYLETLSGIPSESATTGPPRPEDIVPEEYFGLTNPMANNWAGSKHEKYGGYLKKLVPTDTADAPSPSRNAWQVQSSPKTPGQGSYLDNL
jgi:hypothetical protein